MHSFRYFFRLVSAFLGRFKGIFAIGIAFGILVFLTSRTYLPLFSAKENERIGIVGRYPLDKLPSSILNLASEGLTDLNEDGSVRSGIASSWETKDNGKTWIFHLNEAKTWQDGKKITSQNIQITFSDVAVEKPDLKTIIFKLQSPFAPFPYIVSKPIFRKGFLGNGSWKIKKITVSGSNVEKMILADSFGNRKTYFFYPTEERAKLAFKLGQIDILSGVFSVNPFDTWKTVKITNTPDYGKYVAIFFNNEKGKVTSDKSLRQALSYAINKNFSEFPRAISPISPNSWAYNPQVKPYNYDPQKAKDMIKELPKGVMNNLAITLSVSPVLLSLAEGIQKDWENLGLKVSIQVAQGVPDQFDAILAIFDISKDPDQYALWHSSQSATNIANYNNPRIDKLLEDGRTEIDQEVRKKIYLDFQRFLVEDSPAVFLYHPASYTITRK
jgi:peptide/nickel transport system substrate-binding protein